MKKIVIYEAMDGTEFKTEKECLEYDILHSSILCIKRLCERNGCDCTTCPYYSTEQETCAVMQYMDSTDSPNTWKF